MRNALQLTLILALVVALSWFAREAQHRRVEIPGRAGWVTTDPDSLYQMRRVERALIEGLPVAERDERMNAPDGAAIPWPPYYTLTLYALLAPFAPRDADELHAWVEMRVASLPLWFSVAGSLLAALAARRLAGNGAALIAGTLHALCGAAVAYGKSGNGDHHAFVSLLAGAMLFTATFAFESSALAKPTRGLLLGALLGVLAGYALGVWVASLMYVVQLELALGWLVVQHARRALPALPALGLAFHLAALATVLPAVLASPWRAENPWFVVNLSWFHVAFLALGALVFAPLFVLRNTRASRAWPWIVAGTLVLLGAWLALADAAPARGLRDGFAWVTRTDEFMARVGESRPLVGPGTGTDLFEALGYGIVLLPIAWLALAWRAFVRGEFALVLWAVAVPLLTAQALRQARFAEALALPMAVVLAWGAAQLVARERFASARLPLAVLGGICAVFMQWPCARRSIEHWRSGNGSPEQPAAIGTRMACEWLRRTAPRETRGAVLANWNAGHAIEWAAELPSIATNFGSYVGEDGFRAPARFCMSEKPDDADALLAERGARFVLVDSELPNILNTLIPLGSPDRRERYVTPGSEKGGGVKAEWCLTMGARLMFDGTVCGPLGQSARPLDRLRLVWVSPLRDPGRTLRSPQDLAPAAWVWERVAGALVEARGKPGDELALQLRVRYPKANREITWSDRTTADADGLARLRVPYATDAPNGEGRTDGGAAWTFGREHGNVAIPSEAVLAGQLVSIAPH